MLGDSQWLVQVQALCRVLMHEVFQAKMMGFVLSSGLSPQHNCDVLNYLYRQMHRLKAKKGKYRRRDEALVAAWVDARLKQQREATRAD